MGGVFSLFLGERKRGRKGEEGGLIEEGMDEMERVVDFWVLRCYM